MKWGFRSAGRGLHSASRLFLAAGALALLLAVGFWAQEWRSSRSQLHASATVTEMEGRQDDQGQLLYYPHFRFRLPDGRLVQVVARHGGESDAFSPGQQIPVTYRAADPQDASIATRRQVYGLAIALGVAGTVLFDTGAVLWVIQRRREMRGLG